MTTHKHNSPPIFYRDIAPSSTIHNIVTILKSLDLFPIQTSWKNNGRWIHSVHLQCMEGVFGSNGKGLTRYSALASAYAELMERLQNQLLTPRHTEYILGDVKTKEEFGFFFAPDEIEVCYDDIPDLIPEGLLEALAPVDGSNTPYYSHFAGYSNSVLCIPFIDVFTGDEVYLPLELLRYLFGSTGMCAGNNTFEALSQGIAEVAERNAMDYIYHNSISPPVLDPALWRENQVISEMISEISRIDGLNIQLRDCSLGMSIPVVAAFFSDQNSCSYHVNFGSHAIIEEAIARTLTETFQGRSYYQYGSKTRTNLTHSNQANKEKEVWSRNFKQLVKKNEGEYPTTFFLNQMKSDPRLPATAGSYDHRDAFFRYARVLRQIAGTTVLVRDVSYLGFPSYQVVIPGLASRRYSNEDIKRYKRRREATRLLCNISSVNRSGLRAIRKSLVEGYVNEARSGMRLGEFLSIPLRPNSSMCLCPVSLFISAISLSMGCYEDSVEYLEQYISHLDAQPRSHGHSDSRQFRCMRDYIHLKHIRKFESALIRGTLASFYPNTMVDRIMQNLQDPSEAFKGLLLPSCHDCAECRARDECMYLDFNDQTSYIKQSMATYSQRELQEEFSSQDVPVFEC